MSVQTDSQYMSDQLSLPICNPPYHYIPGFNHSMVMFYANDRSLAEKWTYNNSLIIYYQHNNDSNRFLHVMPDFPYDQCRFIEHYNIPADLLDRCTIEDFLRQKYYVVALIDAFHIPNYQSHFNRRHMKHQILIYGFDSESYFCADYFSRNDNLPLYRFEQVEKEKLLCGYQEVVRHDSPFCNTNLCRFRPVNYYKIDINRIKNVISCFLNNEPPYMLLNPIDNEIKLGANPELAADFYYGIDIVYKRLAEDAEVCADQTYVMLRNICGLLAHANIINDFFTYMKIDSPHIRNYINMWEEEKEYALKACLKTRTSAIK